MVLFYFYTASISTVATQYHMGVYVFITYVLVLLLYPAGKLYFRIPLTLFTGFVVSSAIGFFLLYDGDPVAFHDRLMQVHRPGAAMVLVRHCPQQPDYGHLASGPS